MDNKGIENEVDSNGNLDVMANRTETIQIKVEIDSSQDTADPSLVDLTPSTILDEGYTRGAEYFSRQKNKVENSIINNGLENNSTKNDSYPTTDSLRIEERWGKLPFLFVDLSCSKIIEGTEHRYLSVKKEDSNIIEDVKIKTEILDDSWSNEPKLFIDLSRCKIEIRESKRNLEDFIINLDELDLFECDLCPFKTNIEGVFDPHMMRHANQLETYDCDKCTYYTSSKYTLKEHKFRMHTNFGPEDVIKCILCSYQTYIKENLRRHILMTHSTRVIKCKKCSFQTKTELLLKMHMKLHEKLEKIQWVACPRCSHQSKDKASLDRHFFQVHQQSKYVASYKDPLKCPVCNYKSYFSNKLKRHMLVHKNSEEIDWFKCNRCGKLLKSKGSLKSHILVVHTSANQGKWFYCEKCDFKARTRTGVKTHANTHKTLEEMPYTFNCSICNYRGKSKSNAKAHMETHKSLDEVVTYDCDKCTYRSRYKHHLKTHVITMCT